MVIEAPASGSRVGRALAALIAVVAGLAVLTEIGIDVRAVTAHGRSWLDGLVTAVGFFTVLTNGILAAVAGAGALGNRPDTFLGRPSTQAAVTVYIVVVGVIFALLLAGLKPLSGLPLFVDNVLHRVTPVLFVLYWLFFVPKGMLRRQDPLWWLIYPTLYVVYSLIYGAATGRYMYPFANVNVLGYPRALTNAAFILLFFFALGMVVVAIDHTIARSVRRRVGPPAP